MTEQDIRKLLHDVCVDLDRQARQVVREGLRKVVLPTVIGAGLALGGCSDDSGPGPKADTWKQPDAKVADAKAGDAKLKDAMLKEMAPVYMAPDAKLKVDSGPVIDYMAPDAKLKADSGPIPPYMAPDKGPSILYMAPDAKAKVDKGPAILYMAPLPDSGGKKP